MKRNLILVCTLLGLLSSLGCQNRRHSSVHLELLGAERRLLEDQWHETQYELERQQELNKRLKSENEELKRQLKGMPQFETTPPASRGGEPPKTSALPDIQIDIGIPSAEPPFAPEPPSLSEETPSSNSQPASRAENDVDRDKRPAVASDPSPSWTPRGISPRVATSPDELPQWKPDR